MKQQFDYHRLLLPLKGNGLKDMIVIEGVVGAGKTSLMKLLAEMGYEEFSEPVVDNPVLPKFYHDRGRYAFTLQVFFLNKRFEYIKQAAKIENSVLDRSIYGDAIFARMLNLDGDMSDEEFMIYQELLENMLEHVHRPKLMIYLDISVDEAVRRINLRGRDYELIVERAYWESLHREYEAYFSAYNFSPVLKIDAARYDFEHDPEARVFVTDMIRKKLTELDAHALA